MSGNNPELDAWSIRQLQETQARAEHEAYDLGLPEGEPWPGAGAVLLECEDNRQGKRALFLSARPVRLGQVDLIVDLKAQPPGRARPHGKVVNMTVSPEALRDLATMLLEAADEAERNKPRPKSVR